VRNQFSVKAFLRERELHTRWTQGALNMDLAWLAIGLISIIGIGAAILAVATWALSRPY
jgi:hypothetical protein